MTSDVWLPFHADEIEGLPEGLSYRFWDGDQEFPADPADCEFYVVPYMKAPGVGQRPLAEMTSLRVVQTLSAGVDHVLQGVRIPPRVCSCATRAVHEASTAELALTLILASLRGVPGFVRAQDEGEWHSGFHPALADKSVLIVGYGSIGSAIEDRLTPLEDDAGGARQALPAPRRAVRCTHSRNCPHCSPRPTSWCSPRPSPTAHRGLVNAEFLAGMKDGALLVNVARGPVVDTKALLAELDSGRLTAALDVTDPEEPLPQGHPLWQTPGVLVSHLGGPASAFLPRAKRLLTAQLSRFVNREPLGNVVLTTGA